MDPYIYIYVCIYMYICIYIYIIVRELDLSHITPQKAHHVWWAPRKIQSTSRRWSHITSVIFCENSLRAPMNSENRIFGSKSRKRGARAVKRYVLNENDASITYALHWGAGFHRLVVERGFADKTIGRSNGRSMRTSTDHTRSPLGRWFSQAGSWGAAKLEHDPCPGYC